jgi:hypothetical protein
MKTIEEEARFLYGNLEKGIGADRRSIFIAGANSKYVQAEKIKAQIEVLEAILNKYIDESLSGFYIRGMISDLQQQLKQIEDEQI